MGFATASRVRLGMTRASLKRARVVCLDIPDDYGFMDPALVALLKRKVGPFLTGRRGGHS